MDTVTTEQHHTQGVGDSKPEYPPPRWISTHIGLQEEDPHRPVPGLHLLSPPDEQDCCGKNADNPSGLMTHVDSMKCVVQDIAK